MFEPKREQALASTSTSIQCLECPELWWDASIRWSAFVTDERPAEVVFYCPDCAEREFGLDARP